MGVLNALRHGMGRLNGNQASGQGAIFLRLLTIGRLWIEKGSYGMKNIADLRQHLFEQLEALTDPKVDLKRVRLTVDVVQLIIDAARVEVQFAARGERRFGRALH